MNYFELAKEICVLPLPYKGYSIERCPVGWQYTHKDYDGPEDKRHGTAKTVDLCMDDIDELEDNP